MEGHIVVNQRSEYDTFHFNGGFYSATASLADGMSRWCLPTNFKTTVMNRESAPSGRGPVRSGPLQFHLVRWRRRGTIADALFAHMLVIGPHKPATSATGLKYSMLGLTKDPGRSFG